MSVAGLVGVVSTVLNWLGLTVFAAIGILSGIVLTIGWLVMAVAIVKPPQNTIT